MRLARPRSWAWSVAVGLLVPTLTGCEYEGLPIEVVNVCPHEIKVNYTSIPVEDYGDRSIVDRLSTVIAGESTGTLSPDRSRQEYWIAYKADGVWRTFAHWERQESEEPVIFPRELCESERR